MSTNEKKNSEWRRRRSGKEEVQFAGATFAPGSSAPAAPHDIAPRQPYTASALPIPAARRAAAVLASGPDPLKDLLDLLLLVGRQALELERLRQQLEPWPGEINTPNHL